MEVSVGWAGVYGTGIGDVGEDVARRMSTDKALSSESSVRQSSLDATDTEVMGESIGSLDKGEGEKEPGMEGSSGVGLTTWVVPAKCSASTSGSWKKSRTSAM
jgi:hypothetical protein